MRKTYLIAYDICCPKRLAKVAKCLEKFGYRWQYSVFRCDLQSGELDLLTKQLKSHIKKDYDSVMIVALDQKTVQNICFLSNPKAMIGEKVVII